MATLDDIIAAGLADAIASGELRAAPSWGRPLEDIDGWDATPESLRLPFKILKDAGFAPPELALFHTRARLREALDDTTDAARQARLSRELCELEQKLALRLESLRRTGGV